jgi:hypothetical protein
MTDKPFDVGVRELVRTGWIVMPLTRAKQEILFYIMLVQLQVILHHLKLQRRTT